MPPPLAPLRRCHLCSRNPPGCLEAAHQMCHCLTPLKNARLVSCRDLPALVLDLLCGSKALNVPQYALDRARLAPEVRYP